MRALQGQRRVLYAGRSANKSYRQRLALTPLACMQGLCALAIANKKTMYSLRIATLRDIPKLLMLQEQVYQNLPDQSLLCCLDEDFIRSLIEQTGRIFLAYEQDTLLGSAAYYAPKQAPDNLGRYLGRANTQLEHVVHLDSIFVLASARGLGIGKKLALCCIQAAQSQHAHLIAATASPQNSASLTLLFALGFRIHTLCSMYGGLMRFVLAKELLTPPSAKEVLSVAMADIEGHKAALNAGYQGFAFKKDKHGHSAIAYTQVL